MIRIDIQKASDSYFAKNPPRTPDAVQGLLQLLGFIAADGLLTDPCWAAYMLATVRHECADHWQPIEEFGKGKGKPYGAPIHVVDGNDCIRENAYYGRGYVQLTWADNYRKLGREIGVGDALYWDPAKALIPNLAYQIMSYGMRKGSFTGVGLSHFINDGQCDYLNARKIINGLDCAERIAGFAREFEVLLLSNLN